MPDNGPFSILIVEDETIIAHDISKTLETYGYQVNAIAISAAQAFEQASQVKPDLALVDIRLHGAESGLSLAGRLYHDLNIPVIILTAFADEAFIQEALANEAYGYLLKPFNHQMLHAAIEVALRHSRSEQKIDRELRILQTLYYSLAQAMLVCNAEGIIKEVNPAAENLLWAVRSDLVGKKLGDLYRFLDENSHPFNPLALPPTLSGEEQNPGGMQAQISQCGTVCARWVKLDRFLLPSCNHSFLVLEDLSEQRFTETASIVNDFNSVTHSISHDLKTPLRAIEGFSQILIDDYKDQLDPTGQDHLGRVRNAARRMERLIDDLLAFARFDRRRNTRVPILLPDLMKEVLQRLAPSIARGKAEIVLDLQASELVADPQDLNQALYHLVENSLKYSASRAAPRVEIASREENGKFLLWVKDNGIGFDMRYHNQIYTIFTRLHRDDEYPGTGLGLAIVSKAMARAGGAVWAQSMPDQGSTFYLEFPLAISQDERLFNCP